MLTPVDRGRLPSDGKKEDDMEEEEEVRPGLSPWHDIQHGPSPATAPLAVPAAAPAAAEKKSGVSTPVLEPQTPPALAKQQKKGLPPMAPPLVLGRPQVCECFVQVTHIYRIP
jgi:hypothetical protein